MELMPVSGSNAWRTFITLNAGLATSSDEITLRIGVTAALPAPSIDVIVRVTLQRFVDSVGASRAAALWKSYKLQSNGVLNRTALCSRRLPLCAGAIISLSKLSSVRA
jgi:hypothetical protein